MSVLRSVPRALIAFGACAALSGCGFIFESQTERQTRNTPDFKSGYADGCATANAQGVDYGRQITRDDVLYKGSKPYRAGWAAGVSACRANLAAQPGTPSHPIPDVEPGSNSH